MGKEMLLKAVTQAAEHAGIELDLPRLPKRQGENKGRMTLDDVLKLFTVVDERKLVDWLPCYVAADLSPVPQVNAESVNVLHMAKKIESLEQRFSGLDTKVDNMCKLVCTQTECEFHLQLFTNHLMAVLKMSVKLMTLKEELLGLK